MSPRRASSSPLPESAQKTALYTALRGARCPQVIETMRTRDLNVSKAVDIFGRMALRARGAKDGLLPAVCQYLLNDLTKKHSYEDLHARRFRHGGCHPRCPSPVKLGIRFQADLAGG